MRIAIITSGYRPGLDGTTIAVHERCRRLSDWGHEVLVVGPDYAPVEQYFPAWREHLGEVMPRVRVVSVPCAAFFGVEWERNPTPRAFRVLERHLEAFAPDLVHVDEPERLTYGYLRRPGLAYARRRGIPAVAFYHTNYVDYGPDFLPLPGPAMRLLQRVVVPGVAAVYNAYDATLVPGRTTAAKLEGYGLRRIVEGGFNGVDYPRFSGAVRERGYFEREFGVADLGDRVVLLFVGRLTPDKGWAFTMRALPALASRVGRDRIAVLVAGGGEMRDEVERTLTRELDAVHFLGRVQPEQMPAVYANADLHVSSSQKENYGLTTLEAFAAGLPVVAPRAGGFIDAIDHDKTGALFAPDDVEDFVARTARFVEDAAWRQACGARGRAFAREMDWDLTIRRWLDAVRSARPRDAGDL